MYSNLEISKSKRLKTKKDDKRKKWEACTKSTKQSDTKLKVISELLKQLKAKSTNDEAQQFTELTALFADDGADLYAELLDKAIRQIATNSDIDGYPGGSVAYPAAMEHMHQLRDALYAIP